VMDEEGLKKAAQKVKNFADMLISGEIFDIPTSHFVFRIPVIKSLLKKLLIWRLKKEQQIHP